MRRHHTPHQANTRRPVSILLLGAVSLLWSCSAIAQAPSRETTQNSILLLSSPLQFLFPANALILGCLTLGGHSTCSCMDSSLSVSSAVDSWCDA